MKKAVVFLANGLEECEGLITVDILRRSDIKVTTVSLTDELKVISSHGITILADALIDQVNFAEQDIIILPGGNVGTDNLLHCDKVLALCRSFAENKMIAAICAAPTVLAALGLLDNKEATCYPTCEGKMQSAICTQAPVTVTGNIITGRSVGTAFLFALTIVEQLLGKEAADKVLKQICM